MNNNKTFNSYLLFLLSYNIVKYLGNALGVVLQQRYTDIQKSAQITPKLGLFHFYVKKKGGGVKFDTILTSKGSGYRLHFKGCLSVSELKFWGFF